MGECKILLYYYYIKYYEGTLLHYYLVSLEIHKLREIDTILYYYLDHIVP